MITGPYSCFVSPRARLFASPDLIRTETGKLGIEIHYPLSFGLHNMNEVPDFIDFDNYGTVTFTPGVQL